MLIAVNKDISSSDATLHLTLDSKVKMVSFALWYKSSWSQKIVFLKSGSGVVTKTPNIFIFFTMTQKKKQVEARKKRRTVSASSETRSAGISGKSVRIFEETQASVNRSIPLSVARSQQL